MRLPSLPLPSHTRSGPPPSSSPPPPPPRVSPHPRAARGRPRLRPLRVKKRFFWLTRCGAEEGEQWRRDTPLPPPRARGGPRGAERRRRGAGRSRVSGGRPSAGWAAAPVGGTRVQPPRRPVLSRGDRSWGSDWSLSGPSSERGGGAVGRWRSPGRNGRAPAGCSLPPRLPRPGCPPRGSSPPAAGEVPAPPRPRFVYFLFLGRSPAGTDFWLVFLLPPRGSSGGGRRGWSWNPIGHR